MAGNEQLFLLLALVLIGAGVVKVVELVNALIALLKAQTILVRLRSERLRACAADEAVG